MCELCGGGGGGDDGVCVCVCVCDLLYRCGSTAQLRAVQCTSDQQRPNVLTCIGSDVASTNRYPSPPVLMWSCDSDGAGPWLPLTSAAWANYGVSFSSVSTPLPLTGSIVTPQSSQVSLSPFGEVHFGIHPSHCCALVLLLLPVSCLVLSCLLLLPCLAYCCVLR